MSTVTPQHHDGDCRLVLDSLPLIANGHWRDPERLPEGTCLKIEAHRTTCASCAEKLEAAWAAGKEAAAFDRLVGQRLRTRYEPEPERREVLADFVARHRMASAADQVCDGLVGERLRGTVALGNDARQSLLAMIEAHDTAGAAPAAPSKASPQPVAATARASGRHSGRRATPVHRSRRPNPRWFVPIAGAAAVLVLMMAGFDSQSTMAEDAISSTENLPVRWHVDQERYEERIQEVFSEIRSDAHSLLLDLMPDTVEVQESQAHFLIRGITNQVQLGGRAALTVEYFCKHKELRCVLHATRLQEGESLPEALGVDVQPIEIVRQGAEKPCRFWYFTVNGNQRSQGVAWNDPHDDVSYLLVAPRMSKEKLKRIAECMRYPTPLAAPAAGQ